MVGMHFSFNVFFYVHVLCTSITGSYALLFNMYMRVHSTGCLVVCLFVVVVAFLSS